MFTSKDIFHHSFKSSTGDTEHFISITAPGNLSVEEQLAHLHKCHIEAMQTLGLKNNSTIFKRVYTSDAINQAHKIYRTPLFADTRANPVALSLVQQQPLPQARVALFAYHIETAAVLRKERIAPHHVIIEKNDVRYMWSTQLCCGFLTPATREDLQIREILNGLVETIGRHGGRLKENCMRTWIYIKNIDILYEGMVKSRREIFQREGMTDDTHYLASTVIEGSCEHQHDFVTMDAYSILNTDKIQITRLNDNEHMCPPKDYKMTFERGTRIAYADRAHVFISGTASIDYLGQSVHHNEVMPQLDATLVNVEGMLKAGEATFNDVMYMLVYLRDPNDFERVNAVLRERFPDLPILILQGAVCRPEWMVEIECMAITANNAPKLRAF